MRKGIFLAVLAVAAMAVPAFASVQNIKISGNIDSTWLNRENFDLGANPADEETQNLFITQTMLQVDADLSDNVATTICLINERAWDQKDATADDSDIDIHYAYVTLREMLYSPLTVVIGRQAFRYGNSFVMDTLGSNNTAPVDSGIRNIAADLTKQTALDAIRAILDYDPLRIEMFMGKVDSNNNTALAGKAAGNDDDVDLYGFNASYELGDSMNTLVEAYFFAKRDKSVDATNGSLSGEEDSIYVPGLRASTNPIEGLNTQIEAAWQGGTKVSSTSVTFGSQKRNALGGQFIANYEVPVLEEYKPIVGYNATYVSGDQNETTALVNPSQGVSPSTGETWTAWDPFFENQAGGTVYNSIFNLSNMLIQSASLQVSPIEDITVKGMWSGLWLDKKYDTATNLITLVQPDGTAVTTINASTKEKYVGNEFDLVTTYNYTEDVVIGANFGWFIPDSRLFASKNDTAATQALVNVLVNF